MFAALTVCIFRTIVTIQCGEKLSSGKSKWRKSKFAENIFKIWNISWKDDGLLYNIICTIPSVLLIIVWSMVVRTNERDNGGINKTASDFESAGFLWTRVHVSFFLIQCFVNMINRFFSTIISSFENSDAYSNTV